MNTLGFSNRFTKNLSWVAIVLAIFVAGCQPGGGRNALWGDFRVSKATITEVHRFRGHDHNIVNLQADAPDGGIYAIDVASFFYRTGGIERWGFPISELFEERPGVLVQYFQSGILEYKLGAGFRIPRIWREYASSSGLRSQVAGSERVPSNESRGVQVGPWRKSVSNVSVEGEETGFADAFVRLGGTQTLGHPKSDARRDTHPSARLRIPDEEPGRVRQYFESAVLEWHPGTAFPIRVAPLGDWMRDLRYGKNEWTELLPFRRTAGMEVGNAYPVSLIRFTDEMTRISSDVGHLMGTSTHPYAIAYHPQGHMIYREGEGWYALFYDGNSGVLSFVNDGGELPQQLMKVTHEKVGPGLALYDHNGIVYVLYGDALKSRIYLRTGYVGEGAVTLAEPQVVLDRQEEFMAYFATQAVGADGLPWVLVRSFQGVTTGTGTVSHLWLTRAQDEELRNWSNPVRITPQADAERATAGSSGSLAVLDGTIVIVFNAKDELVSFVGSVEQPGKLVRQSLGGSAGIHDHIAIVRDGILHLAYHAPGAHGSLISHRTWSRENGWSARNDLARTGDHATAMTIDSAGNVWIFYGTGTSVTMRVKQAGAQFFGPERCIVTIDSLRADSYVWLAAANTGDGDSTGLLWMERPIDDRWEVRFKKISLSDFHSAPLCDST
jgi:hypothetical protein